MELLNTFKVNAPKTWIDLTEEDPNGSTTYIRKQWNQNPGILQISAAQHIPAELTQPNFKDLINLSKEFDAEKEFDLMNTNSGHCKYGKYGYAEFKNSEFPFVSVWHLSSKTDIVYLTYISIEHQTESDIDEVYTILKNISHQNETSPALAS
jgi:hypothetical protein|tara:strand:- start:13 stop:468 length:456 start_codon:yes stop_codon:yes gene_type:complete